MSRKRTPDAEAKAEDLAALRHQLGELRRTVDDLRQSHEKYRLICDQMLNAYALHEIVLDEEGNPYDVRYLEVNPAWERVTGLRGAEVLGKTAREVLPEIDPKIINRLGKVALSGEPDHFQTRTRDRDRDRYWEVVAYRSAPGQFVTVFSDLSERTQTEKALRESEARYRALFEQAHDSIFIVDPQTRRFLDVNENACRRLGYTREELMALRVDDVEVPATEASSEAVIAAVQASGGMVFEQEHRRRDGSTMPVELSARVVELGGRKVFQSNARDITKRRQAEKALRETEERFRNVFDNATDGIFVCRPDGRIREINRRACQSLGYTRDELLDMSVDEIDETFTAEKRAQVMSRLAPSRTLVFESEQRRKDGSRFPIEVHIGLLEQGGERLVMGLVRDITERKAAEAAMRRLSGAVEHSPNAVVITDAAGTIEYVNPAFTTTTGYRRDEVEGRNFLMLKSGKMQEEVYETLWRTISGGEVWRGELCNRKKDGDLYWELVSISSIKDEDGRITNYIAIQEDITEHKRIEEELAQAQRLEVVGQLTGGVAHDFNNLLTVILGNVELLVARLADDESRRRLAEAALHAAQRGSELTHRLLAFSRKQPLRPGAVEVEPLVAETVDLLRRTLGESIEIEIVSSGPVPPIFADAGQVQNALLNLALNARDAMREGGKLTIEVAEVDLDNRDVVRPSAAGPGNYVLLEVRDTGCGMSPEVAQRAVEPFFTTKGMATHSGLGLSMVYGFAKQSGGHVEIASQEGVGTRVKLVLPRAEVVEPEAVGRLISKDLPRGSETVLVVEDSPAVRNLTATLLASLGYQVLEAADGPSALAVLDHAGPVDLLFTDLVMPGGLSGYELARRACDRFPELKVVLTSGYADELEPTADFPFLNKPYRRRDLAHKLREVLG